MNVQQQQSEPGVNMMLEVLNVSPPDFMMLTIDSGSFLCTCPRDWCAWLPTQTMKGSGPRALAANGAQLTFYGTRMVKCRAWGGLELAVRFHVSDVTRPIVSVGVLRRQGIYADFSGQPALLVRGNRVPMVERGNLFYLPVSVEAPAVTDSQHGLVAAMTEETPMCAAVGGSTMKFVEYVLLLAG